MYYRLYTHPRVYGGTQYWLYYWLESTAWLTPRHTVLSLYSPDGSTPAISGTRTWPNLQHNGMHTHTYVRTLQCNTKEVIFLLG